MKSERLNTIEMIILSHSENRVHELFKLLDDMAIRIHFLFHTKMSNMTYLEGEDVGGSLGV